MLKTCLQLGSKIVQAGIDRQRLYDLLQLFSKHLPNSLDVRGGPERPGRKRKREMSFFLSPL